MLYILFVVIVTQIIQLSKLIKLNINISAFDSLSIISQFFKKRNPKLLREVSDSTARVGKQNMSLEYHVVPKVKEMLKIMIRAYNKEPA